LCRIIAGDLTSDGEAQRIVDSAVASLGGLTTLVNCAGVLKGGAFGSDACNLDNFLYNFNGNTKSVFEMMQHAIPHLKIAGAANAGGASIINVSSVNGVQSFGGVASYCASKAAVDQLSRCAAVDLAPFGIRVNAVNPGVICTELQKRGGLTDEAYASFIDRSIDVTHPIAKSLGRVGVPEEVGDLLAFLASDKAKFITGDCIKVSTTTVLPLPLPLPLR
jgi:NAD(P)-dependent dehydrogenase (short-subunit alcohol dehydrogenase family)